MSNKPILGGRLVSHSVWPALALVISAWAVTGCGQKGPLYLAPAAAAPAPVPSQPAKAATLDDKTSPANAVTAPGR